MMHSPNLSISEKLSSSSENAARFAGRAAAAKGVRHAAAAPKDLMHVELEGNLKAHLHGFLQQAIKHYKWFTRAQLNSRIRAFKFPSDRPPEIPATNLKGVAGNLPSHKGSITMTSGQMLQFVIYSLEIFRPLLTQAARTSAEYAAWVAHVTYFQALLHTTSLGIEARQTAASPSLGNLQYRASVPKGSRYQAGTEARLFSSAC